MGDPALNELGFACPLLELEAFTHANEDAPARAVLRRANANALTVTDEVAFVENIGHVETQRQAFEGARAVKRLSNADIGDDIAGQLGAIGNRTGRICGAQAVTVQKVHAGHELAKTIGQRNACATRKRPILRMVGVDVVSGDIGQFGGVEEVLARDDVPRLLLATRDVCVKRPWPVSVIRAQFDAPGIAFGIVERRIDQ